MSYFLYNMKVRLPGDVPLHRTDQGHMNFPDKNEHVHIKWHVQFQDMCWKCTGKSGSKFPVPELYYMISGKFQFLFQ